MNIRSQVIFFFFFRFVHFIPFYFGYLTAWFQLESLTGLDVTLHIDEESSVPMPLLPLTKTMCGRLYWC
ncbi:hypothetical protein RCL_jg9812.t2 [Rhizophagus clarus]|uniref:Uncharacterized protein n=1 Tax=Rhizophagus clarus TaxID=94130 RepID=A0A8H3LYP4_9GLOM|nr:hypothetical protein RCL_jg9812.t2 [Rhizophagus clarus]